MKPFFIRLDDRSMTFLEASSFAECVAKLEKHGLIDRVINIELLPINKIE